MHFLVTGGAGFIGSHVVEHLLSNGHSVTVIDNLSTGSLDNLPDHRQLILVNKNLLACQPKDFTQPIDGIAHLAAIPSVEKSWLQPLETHQNNLSATISVILLCKALQIPRLVFASSSAVYGDTSKLPVKEEYSICPVSPYGLQKIVSERYISLFSQQLNLSSISLRLFNVFGPRQNPYSHYSGVISIFTNALKQKSQITIYGDGSQTRDFIYVKDVVNAFVIALTIPLSNRSNFVCNIGTGRRTSLLDLVNILKSHFTQWDSLINFADFRPGDIRHSQADISRSKSYLNFTPQWSVESGLSELINL